MNGLTWKEIEEMDRKADIAPPFGDTPHHIDMIAKARHAVSAVRAHCNAAPESPGCLYPTCDCKVVPRSVLDGGQPALAAADAGGWLPMDSSPDSEWVLVWDGNVRAVARLKMPQAGNPVALAVAGGDKPYWNVVGSAFGIKPIAWQPLPSPPSTKAQP